MGVKVRWDLGEEPDESALDSSGIYAGDTPPKGMYTCRVVGARVKPNKNEDPRVNFWIEVQESGSKKQYSGYRFYDGQNVAVGEVQQRIWKQIAHALGLTYAAIQTKTTVNSLSREDIEKLGGVIVEKLPKFSALCKAGTYQGEPRLEIVRWLPLSDSDDDEGDSDDDDDGDDADEPPF